MNHCARVAAALLAAFTGLAQAHRPSDAYLSWQVDGATVEQRVDIALRDLDRDLGLDADDDGLLTWRELRLRWRDVERLAADGLRVQADGEACRVEATAPPQLDDHGDGTHAVLRQTLRCARPVRALQVDYRLFAATDPTHRGIARVTGTGETTAVLVPGSGTQSLPVGGAAARSFGGFVAEGLRHIAAGLDHLLFLATLLMVAVWRHDGRCWVPRERAHAAWSEALRLVTAFTVAHSLTLALAAFGMLAPPARWIESLIALSVLVAALDNLRPFVRAPRVAMVAGFGLVHGFGFAGPLQELGLRGGELALPLLAFNLGVELGQIAFVALLLPLASALRATAFYRRAIVRPGSALIAVVALGWTVQRAFLSS